MLHLPVELVISILKYLPLSTLSNLLSTSREWNNFFQVNQSILYHNAAVLHGFTPSTSVVYSDLTSILSRRSLTGVTDWKSFCCTQVHIQRAWRGKASSCVTAHRRGGNEVHRIKVDEQRGFIIVTTSSGGLLVVDLYEDKVLWALPENYVHAYAHCEYSAGYLIFDRESGEKEVWRVADDAEMTPASPTFAFPDEAQDSIPSWAADLHDFPLATRGHFKPWMVLKPPAFTGASRCIYPTLIAATATSVLVWDLPTGELVQVIQDIHISPDLVLGRIHYVEASARTNGHIFVCGSNTLRVFSRASGRCVLDLPSWQISYGRNAYSFTAGGGHDHEQGWLSNSVLKPQSTTHRVVPPINDSRHLLDQFIAVHVSACGLHFAALLASSRLIIVPFFERISSGAADIHDISLDLQLGSPASVARYLAFENGRVGVATDTGLFLVTVDFESLPISTDPPRVSVYRAAWFNDPILLTSVTCLQMTTTGIFLTWDPMPRTRDYQEDDLIPAPEFEERFISSLSENPRRRRLHNGDDLVQLFELPVDVRQGTSSVFSVDFVPTGAY
ncbi:hypothetical protein B0H11DRAFT_2066218 [Mycena galericulata]|nr:hypothetical protein B0H11DRAFT_2066218 [Mycena galericulata]